MIDLCSVLDCSVLNGEDSFQFDDAMTFISTTGKSVIHYFVLSSDLCHSGFLSSLKVLERIASSHLPVTLDIFTALGGRSNSRLQVQKVEKFVWNKEILFVNELNSAEMQNRLEQALHDIPNYVNNVHDLFVDCVTSASHCREKTNKQKNHVHCWVFHE